MIEPACEESSRGHVGRSEFKLANLKAAFLFIQAENALVISVLIDQFRE